MCYYVNMAYKKSSKNEPTISDVLQAVIKGFENNEKRFQAIESRIDRLEMRMDGLENRIDGLEERMERGFHLLRIDINALQAHLPPINIAQLYEDVQNIKLKLDMK